MITANQYTRTYEAHQKILHEDAKRINASADARAFLMKNLQTGDAEELLGVAVVCIADMTGDKTLIKALRRRDDSCHQKTTSEY